ncbi:hypothetical protein FOQG_13864 [Fusarium oxysporum f. sp. raphani 54005]|uniref:Uncharacterized protein n=3 Tax=Fusarium oxysporum TaxID=5507 RepID=X0CGS2_FUSOX|nr:hypothetical protein FOVG_16138 [Fusarium oxysporum f. sp. pisi HDV247]EXK81792.1 hypothetical protein FOQG_13864 [Fusarium oxysporum f. sp. raphani 54005]EXL70224.1 hypothetical protein FOPG_13923 [Fusarium oxysporum f. sp. conglutinans race 2 54008]
MAGRCARVNASSCEDAGIGVGGAATRWDPAVSTTLGRV